MRKNTTSQVIGGALGQLTEIAKTQAPKPVKRKIQYGGRIRVVTFEREPTQRDIQDARLHFLKQDAPMAFKRYQRAEAAFAEAKRKGDLPAMRQAATDRVNALQGAVPDDDRTGPTEEQKANAAGLQAVGNLITSGGIIPTNTKKEFAKRGRAITKEVIEVVKPIAKKYQPVMGVLPSDVSVDIAGSIVDQGMDVVDTEAKIKRISRVGAGYGTPEEVLEVFLDSVGVAVPGAKGLAPAFEKGIAKQAINQAGRGFAGRAASMASNPRVVRPAVLADASRTIPPPIVAPAPPPRVLSTTEAKARITAVQSAPVTTEVRPSYSDAPSPMGPIRTPDGFEFTGRFDPQGKPILRAKAPSEVAPGGVVDPVAAPTPVLPVKTASVDPLSVVKPTPTPKGAGPKFSARNADTSARRAELGLDDLPQGEKQTLQETFELGKTRNPDKVQLKAKNGEVLDAADVGALARKGAELERRLAKLRPGSEKYLDALAEYDDLTTTLAEAGRLTGQALQARKIIVQQIKRNDFGVTAVRGRALNKLQKQADGTFDRSLRLSPEVEKQIADSAATIETLQKQVAELEAKHAGVREGGSRMVRVQKIRETRSALEQELAQLRKGGGMNATSRRRGAAATNLNAGKQIATIAKIGWTYVDEGIVSRLDDVLKAVNGLARTHLGRELTRDELAVAMKEVRAKGETLGPITPQEAAKRQVGKEVAEASKPLGPPRGLRPREAKPKLGPPNPQAALNDVEDQIAATRKAIEAGDLEGALPKRNPKLPEPLELRIARNKLDKERGAVRRLIEDQNPKTTLDKAAEIAGVPRSLLSTLDNSMLGRQGLLMGLDDPKGWGKAGVNSVKAIKEGNFIEMERVLRANPLFDEAQMYGLHFDDPLSLGFGGKAEEFSRGSTIFDKLERSGNVVAKVAGSGANVAVKGGERVGAAVQNTLRMRAWERARAQFPNATPEQLKDLAGMFNAASGRGYIGKDPNIAKALGAAFFSPRYLMSRWQVLTKAGSIRKAIKGDPAARIALRQTTKLVGVYAGIATLAVQNGGKVSFDPESPDFLKIRFGLLTIDPGTGFVQIVRLLARTGQLFATNNKGKGFGFSEVVEPGARYLQYKASPAATGISGIVGGKDAIGKDQNRFVTVGKLGVPLTPAQAIEASTEKGATPALPWLVAGLNFWGVGADAYNPNEKKRKGAKKPPETLPKAIKADAEEVVRYLQKLSGR